MNPLSHYLLEIQAIKLSPEAPFTWASGRKSPIYCDNRITLSYPKVRDEICNQFVEKIKAQYPQAEVIAGVATGGIAHGVLVAQALGLPFVYIRDKPKAHGRQNLVEGDLKPNQKVVIIEDLISTGGSSLKAVEGIRESGAEVLGLLAIFTYGFSQASEAFKNATCNMDTLTCFSELIQALKEQSKFPQKDIEYMEAWIKS
jgi:orotate phosphoribosyltransferase